MSTIRKLLSLLLLCAPVAGYGQDSSHVSLIYKIDTAQMSFSSAEDLTRKSCLEASFQYASLKIFLSGKQGNKDTLFYEKVNSYQWGDSVLLSFNLPGSLRGKRISFQPIYHYICLKSSDSSRDFNTMFDLTEKAAGARFINLNISSTPPGAKVYLIPKLFWIRNPDLLTPGKKEQLSEFSVYQKKTPVTTQVLEYVYIVVYEIQDKFGHVEIHPNFSIRPNDAVNFEFN